MHLTTALQDEEESVLVAPGTKVVGSPRDSKLLDSYVGVLGTSRAAGADRLPLAPKRGKQMIMMSEEICACPTNPPRDLCSLRGSTRQELACLQLSYLGFEVDIFAVVVQILFLTCREAADVLGESPCKAKAING